MKIVDLSTIVSALIAVLTLFGIKHYKDILGFYRNILERTKKKPGWIILFHNDHIDASKNMQYVRDWIINEHQMTSKGSKNQRPTIEQIIFTPQGSIVALFHKGKGNNKKSFSSVEKTNRNDLKKIMRKFSRIGATIDQISFAPNGSWAILYDFKGRKNCEVSEGHSLHFAFKEKINALLIKKNERIQHIVFPPKGGWIILVDRSGKDCFYFDGINDNYPELITEIEERCRQKKKIKQVAFISDQSWLILFEDGYPHGAVPNELQKRVKFRRAKGIKLKQIIFIP